MDITAQEILNSLFNPEDKVCLRVFDDKKRGVFAGQKLDVECGKFASIEETLRQHNAQYDAKDTGGEVIRWYRVRKSWADAKSQKGAYKILDNAKK